MIVAPSLPCFIYTIAFLCLLSMFQRMSSFAGDIYSVMRQHMVDVQLLGRGITNVKVLESMRTVPRHFFVPHEWWNEAYSDGPLPIGFGQTISQPYIVAFMAQAAIIQPTDKVLEIGTGCGYSAAVLSNLCKDVYSIETISGLAKIAQPRLQQLGFHNVHCFHSDGSIGLPEHAPYDAIIVTAGAPKVPNSLLEQLAPGGRMVIPVNKGPYEELVRVTKDENGEYRTQHLMDVRFVPLVGEEGWNEKEF